MNWSKRLVCSVGRVNSHPFVSQYSSKCSPSGKLHYRTLHTSLNNELHYRTILDRSKTPAIISYNLVSSRLVSTTSVVSAGASTDDRQQTADGSRQTAPADVEQSHYDVLGVKRESTKEQIKDAYIQKTKLYHPDSNPADETLDSLFWKVTEAYSVLSDEKKRQSYDKSIFPDYDGDEPTDQPTPPPKYQQEVPARGPLVKPSPYPLRPYFNHDPRWDWMERTARMEDDKRERAKVTVPNFVIFGTVFVIMVYIHAWDPLEPIYDDQTWSKPHHGLTW